MTDAELETFKHANCGSMLLCCTDSSSISPRSIFSELAVDSGGQAVADGEDGRGGIESRWRLHAASFKFGTPAEQDESISAAKASRCSRCSC